MLRIQQNETPLTGALRIEKTAVYVVEPSSLTENSVRYLSWRNNDL